ncbi:MAG: Sec-dependent nitrous-oxide reductase [Deltaproteobacteria bacterium]|nr:Sec-dependent nitrous-oxide reductase [Deltaproteobacteria bacterium]
MRIRTFKLGVAELLAAGLLATAGCSGPVGPNAKTTPNKPASTGAAGGGGAVAKLMKERGLSEADVTAALKTYTPTGKKDEYYVFASGGHGGNLLVIGVPSMRILKYVAVFTAEPWQGYGYGDKGTEEVLKGGNRAGHELRWGDMHHPALSETNGEYDGQFVFVNDKANPRIAVVNLADFQTEQIIGSELIQSEHGGAFVTPNTDYVIETSQYAAPLGGAYADLKDYNEKYRGAMIFWKFDRAKRRIVESESFAIEFPPYMQDLADAGKLTSDGWAFCNSINTERATGGVLDGQPPLESGSTQNDMDYMHVINWRKAEAIAKAGKVDTIAGMKTIRLQTAIDEGILHFVPEPKSPHGLDVTPDGEDLVVGGKLDTHATIYNFKKIKALIEAKKYAGKDPYGVPILPHEEAMRGQVDLGLGPLHTAFDPNGFAYTSLFIETKVAKWNYKELKMVEKISTHYNIGHLVAAEGDTVSPDGRYLIAMNKWALDRFAGVGPLLPQNFQLIDLTGADNGGKMQLLYDMPLPLGEPHNAQMIKADKLKPIDIYKPVGMDPITKEKSPNAVEGGKERIERKADGVHVYMTAIRSHFTPDVVKVKQGDKVHVHLTSLEQAHDATHGFALDSYNINVSLEPGEHADVEFVADRSGVFPMYCTEFCSALHLEMAGYFLVEPKK